MIKSFCKTSILLYKGNIYIILLDINLYVFIKNKLKLFSNHLFSGFFNSKRVCQWVIIVFANNFIGNKL